MRQHERVFLSLILTVTVLSFVNCSGGSSSTGASTTTNSVLGAGNPNVPNRCYINILKCPVTTVNLTSALSNVANSVSQDSCVAAARTLKTQCKLTIPVSVSFSTGGIQRSSTTVF